MNALEGVWENALEEFRDWQDSDRRSDDLQRAFCYGYVFGTAFGLALSTVRPGLVRKFEQHYRERGWLDGHEKFESSSHRPSRRDHRPGKRRGRGPTDV
ncbi:MAG TPA: hypothetical protein VGF55_28190 [Gemmataceae bacterium]|jgi:hypothetical protein